MVKLIYATTIAVFLLACTSSPSRQPSSIFSYIKSWFTKSDTTPLPDGVVIRDVEWQGHQFQVVSVDTKKIAIHMKSMLSTSGRVKTFSHLQEILEQENRKLIFSTNGGMFHENLNPVGLYIENYQALSLLNMSDGQGNFFLKPNGVFALTKTGPVVWETNKWSSESNSLNVEFATQSGPMLVIDDVIHPAFMTNSPNLNIRSGVGVSRDHIVHFVLSLNPVRFYDVADFYKSYLNCPNALYLDGLISQNFINNRESSNTSRNFGVFLYIDQATHK